MHQARIRIICAAVCAVFSLAVPAATQQLELTLTMSPRPSPFIADWQSRRETATLVVRNTGSPVDARLDAVVQLNEAPAARTKRDRMPIITIPSGTSTFGADELLPAAAIEFFGGVEQTARRTGSIPAGLYRLCVTLQTPSGAPLVAPACAVFIVTEYAAPMLLQPVHGADLRPGTAPTFRWTPLIPTPPTPARYVLRVFEVLEGQTPMQAFRANAPLVDRDAPGRTQFQLTPDLALPDRGTFVWTVLAYPDASGAGGSSDPLSAEPQVFTVGLPRSAIGWAIGEERALHYDAVVERGLKDGAPEVVDRYALTYRLRPDGTVDAAQDGTPSGAFRYTRALDFDCVDPDTVPPYWSILLFSLLPPDLRNTEDGMSWTVRFPSDAHLATTGDGKIAMQDRFSVRVVAAAGGRVRIRIDGSTRIVGTTRARTLLEASPSSLALLDRWTPFLEGEAEYDATRRAISRAELYYVLAPESTLTPGGIRESVHRHHTTLVLK